jgi:hypothetical protein
VTDPLDPKELEKIAFGLYPHLYPGGEQTVDSESLNERVQRIRRGLLPENEFFAIVSWLGKCAGIHRIDQTPMPVKDNPLNLRAPDFIAFPVYKGKIVPVLIEVKTDDKLVWSESYYNSLKGFAELLNLPLLVAWKTEFMWLLVDHSHFQKKVTAYHLEWQTAVKENLLSLLFGNIFIDYNDDVSLVIECEILDPIPPPDWDLLPEGPHHLQIKQAGIYIGDKKLNKEDIPAECYTLVFAIATNTEVKKVSDNIIKITHRPDPGGIQLVNLFLFTLFFQYDNEEAIEWDQVLRQGPFSTSGQEFRVGFRKPEAEKFINYLIQQAPVTMPHYLIDQDVTEEH